MSIGLVSRQGTTVDAVDLFCGYGGTSGAVRAAGAVIKVAANHSKIAIECHAANFPGVDHRRADLSDPDSADYVDPADLPAATLLVASPSCKFHSLANAKKVYARGPQASFFDEDFDEVAYANSERSRVTMLCPLRYAAKHRPELVVVENVVEAAKWGPNRDGSTFRWWLAEWEKLGYDHEALFFNSMFFPPCPQSRDRMYVVCWRRGNRRPDLDYRPRAQCTSDNCQGAIVDAVQTWKERTAAWPLARWGKYGKQYTYTCPVCHARVYPVAWPAYSAIDWADLGPRLCERDSLGMTPLAPATIERIRRGVTKFRGGPSLLIPTKATWGIDRPVTGPFPTQTSAGERGLVTEGAVVPLRTNGVAAGPGDSMRTVVAGNVGHAVVGRPFVVKNNGALCEAKYRACPVTDPLGALTVAPAQQLAIDGVTVVAAGHTFERPGSACRTRHLAEPLFTQHGTEALGFAHSPFVATLRGGGSIDGQAAVVDALGTISAGGLHHGLTSPALFEKLCGGPADTAWHAMSDPLNTVTARDIHGMIVLPWLEQWRSDPVAITEQLATVMSHLGHSLVSMEADLDPVTDEELGAIRFRMLSPDPELSRAMAFSDDYILLGNKTQVTSGLGNAVTPPVATWITRQCLATLEGR
ncbi:MAG: DNA cytosine methyltransferase [Acidimicrobiales bacterium]